MGVLVLVVGVGLAIWKAETTGDLYVSAVASAAGLVSTVIGQLAHRRADAAMAHMQRQTADLRQDMKRERETETAIRLTSDVEDHVLRAELQAALVLKLSGATLGGSTWLASGKGSIASGSGRRRCDVKRCPVGWWARRCLTVPPPLRPPRADLSKGREPV